MSFVALQSRLNGYVLDVCGGNNSVGASVWMYPFNGTDAQKWILTGDGYVQSALRTNDGRELVLDVQWGNPNVGAGLQLYFKNGTAAQKWSYNGNALVSWLTGYVLDIQWGNPSVGASLWMYPSNGTNAQNWNLLALTSDNGYE